MSEQNKDLVRRYYGQVVNGRDLDAVGDYFADERTAAGVREGLLTSTSRHSPISTSLWMSSSLKGIAFPSLDNDGHSRRRVPGHPCHGTPHRRRVSGGVPGCQRQVRRLLVHGGGRGPDAPAHGGATGRPSVTDPSSPRTVRWSAVARSAFRPRATVCRAACEMHGNGGHLQRRLAAEEIADRNRRWSRNRGSWPTAIHRSAATPSKRLLASA